MFYHQAKKFSLIFLICSIFLTNIATAESVIEIKHQQFFPMKIVLPPGKKVKLTLKNNDAIPAEFESTDLSREIIVPGHDQVIVYVGPLDPGNYRFFNDFNRASKGTITVLTPSKRQ
ncbi:MAG: cupredoxin domain-containing protein [Proteobacteria bacterium]|nr:cupredoxin domain-containing protein [Pseudomonadota bacterium]